MKPMMNIRNENKRGNRFSGWLQNLSSWNEGVPLFRQIELPSILALFAGVALAFFTRGGECTCAEQIPDTAMYSIARAGNKEATRYLERKENVVVCAAMRAEILKKMKSTEGVTN